MRYGKQLQKALELVGERDLAEEVTVIWIQDEGEEPDEIPFIQELEEDEELDEEDEGVESLHDLFITIAENKPHQVLLRFDGKEVEIFNDES